MKSFFDNIPAALPGELFETIVSSETVTIERIVSKGHASPQGFWYDQDKNEFVLLVRGSARVKIKGEPDSVSLKAGDCLNIKAHVKHRLEWTDPKGETIWLAVYY